MTKITAHRALAELKTLITTEGGRHPAKMGRIEAAIHDAVFCIANKKSNAKIGGMGVEEYGKAVITASYDKATGLIKRYNDLKTALVMSNAGFKFDSETPVELVKHDIAGESMTVAQIIERKSSIKYDRMLLEAMKSQYRSQMGVVNKENDSMPQKVERYLANSGFGNRDNSNAEEIKKVEDQFKENQTFVLVDPLNILDKINKLEEKITTFEIEVDALLSEVNATTFINVAS